VSDDFNTSTLNSIWTFVNPLGDGSYQMTGTNLQLNVPAGQAHDLWTTGDNAVRVMQTISNSDFQVEAKFNSTVNQGYQMQGIVVEQDNNNFARFEILYTGSAMHVFAATIIGASANIWIDTPISISAPMWVKVQRTGNTWTESWSTDGNTFTVAGSFQQALTVARIGPFAANSTITSSPPPAFTGLVDYFYNTASAGVPDLTITKSHSGNFTQGATGSYSLTASNSGTGPTSGTMTVTDTLPTGLTATALTGPVGWTCTLATVSCSSNSGTVLAASATAAFTLTVSVAQNAVSGTNNATVSGGGETNTANDSASDPTTITAAGVPDLTITKSHSGNFTQGATGSYSLTASNSGTGPTSGTMKITDTLPTGLTATALTGPAGWTCTLATVSCSSNSGTVLAASATAAFTLTVSVAQNAVSGTNNATVSGGGETNTANDSASDPTTITAAAGQPVSDDFHSASLNSIWTFVNPLGDGSYQMTGTNLLLSVPAGQEHNLWTTGEDAVRVMQTVSNSNFQVQAEFDSTENQGYQTQGIVVEQDSNNFARFEILCTGSATHVFAATIIGANATIWIDTPITVSGPTWVQVQRTGNTWTESWSTDGNTFTVAGSFQQALTVARMGPFVGNTALGSSPPPAFTASVNYFFNTASPIVPQDGGAMGITLISVTPSVSAAVIAWTTDRPATSQVNYGTTSSYNLSTTFSNTLVTNHSATLTGLSCGTTYHYSVTSMDSMGNPATSPDSTFVPPCSLPGAVISDDFSGTTLNSFWTFVNPLSDASYSLNGSTITLSVPGGVPHDAWTSGDQAVRIMQPIADQDFEVEAKFNSSVNINLPYQEQGIIVEQDSSTFLRFGMHSANQQTILFVAAVSSGNAAVEVNVAINGGAAMYMRVKRTGSSWLFSYSYDSLHWTPAYQFSQTIQVARIGPFAGNGQYNSQPVPAFTAIVDHFINFTSPPSTVDGNAYPPPLAPPTINVWYGDSQTFGQIGVPQQWVNILGDVSDFNQVTTLTYSLNGGPAQTLWMGENDVRLVAPGDYNVEIDYASLNPGNNTVAITATDTNNLQTTHTVTVNYAAGNTWPQNYSINWSQASSIQSVAQIVDGLWQIQPDGTVRTEEIGYDRLLAIGDRNTWQNYVASAEVTIHSLNSDSFGLGIVVGWQGHTTVQYGVALPDQPRTGHPFPAYGQYTGGTGPSSMSIWTNTATVVETALAQAPLTLQLGVTYVFKIQAQQNTSGGSTYSFKIWPKSSSEPAAWNLQANGEACLGSILLAAYYADVSFGPVTIQGL